MTDLMRLAELCEAATPGEWIAFGETAVTGSSFGPWGRVSGPTYVQRDRSEAFAPADAAFIAAARTAVPELLSMIHSLTAERDAAYSNGWQTAHSPLPNCGHPRSCYLDKNWPESERNYNPETRESDPPMEYRCIMCEIVAERDAALAAIAPFAAVAREDEAHPVPDNFPLWPPVETRPGPREPVIRMGDCRRAAALVTPKEKT
jgi:hypothetical protein